MQACMACVGMQTPIFLKNFVDMWLEVHTPRRPEVPYFFLTSAMMSLRTARGFSAGRPWARRRTDFFSGVPSSQIDLLFLLCDVLRGSAVGHADVRPSRMVRGKLRHIVHACVRPTVGLTALAVGT